MPEISCVLLEKEEWDFCFYSKSCSLQAFGEGGEQQLESFSKMTQSCLAKVQELTKQYMYVCAGGCRDALCNDMLVTDKRHSIMQ